MALSMPHPPSPSFGTLWPLPPPISPWQGSGLLVANSLAHTSGELLGGVAWQLIAGVGTYVAYQNTPVYERLIALSGCKGHIRYSI